MSWKGWAAGVAVVVVGLGAMNAPDETAADAAATITSAPVAPVETDQPTAEAPPTPTATAAQLLRVVDLKDGDSWVASDSQEYRLGQVNTPELSEPCGSEAADFTRRFLANGFTADAYSSDTYGRTVAEVFDAAGTSLNVALARSGYGNDRYLEQFRSENPDLAARLDAAFARATTPSCQQKSAQARPFVAATPAAPKQGSSCMPGYSPCLEVVDDLDCPDIGQPVRVTGDDPYRLDRDGDGTGCD